MLILKQTSLTVLTLSTSIVFAGTMGSICTPGNVTIPCSKRAWDIAAQALYLKPSYSSVYYFGLNQNANGTVESYNRKNFDWAWGFKLEASYHFNTGNDVDINWYHLKMSDAQTFPNVAQLIFNANTTVNTTLRGNPTWDAVNAEFAQSANFGKSAKVRYFGGVEYARIFTKISVSGTETVFFPAGTGPYFINSTMTYKGFGPRIGTDLSYNVNNGLNIYANAAAGLLVGTSSFTRTSSTSLAAGSVPPNVSDSNSQIVPELEIKLGAMCVYTLAQGNLNFDAGWMWVNYFHAQQVGINNLIDGAGSGSYGSTSDFGIQGPYFGLKWIGNIASI